MVQILRDQMRQYSADQTDSIKQAQRAQNVKEWGGVVGTVKNVGLDVLKKRESADRQIINTEMGNKAGQELSDWAETQSADYLSSPKGREEIERRASEIYGRWGEKMSSQYGRDAIAGMQRKAADTLIASASKNVGKETSAKAQVAASNLLDISAQDASIYGINSDLEGYIGATEDTAQALIKFHVSRGMDEGVAARGVKTALASNYLSAEAQVEPEKVAAVLGMDGYESTEETNAYLADLLGADAMGALSEKQVYNLKAERADLVLQLKGKTGDAKRIIKDKIADIDARIENADGESLEVVKADLRNMLEPQVRRAIGEKKLEEEKAKRYSTVQTIADVMSPDIAKRTWATLWARGDNEEKAKAIAPLIGDNGLTKARTLIDNVNIYIKNSQTVKQELVPTYEGTMAMKDRLDNLMENLDYNDPFTNLINGYAAINEAHNSDITDEQLKDYETIVHNVLLDSNVGTNVKLALKESSVYRPNITWFDKYWSSPAGKEFGAETTTDIRRQDIDTAEKRWKAGTMDIIKNTMSMLAIASNVPDNDKQQQLVGQARDYFLKARKDLYNDLVSGYGINLPALEEQLNTKGYAYQQIGGQLYEFKNYDSEGNPLFSPNFNRKQQEQIAKQLGLVSADVEQRRKDLESQRAKKATGQQ